MDTASMKKKTIKEKQFANKTETSSSELMSVSEMGSILGLKKTDRYWLIHKEFLKPGCILGRCGWFVKASKSGMPAR